MNWFADRLKSLGKTHEQLAAALGRERSVITKMIRGGKSLRLSQVPAAAAVFEATVLEVLFRTGLWRDRSHLLDDVADVLGVSAESLRRKSGPHFAGPPSEARDYFSKNLRRVREDRGFAAPGDLAEAAHIKPARYRRIEAGEAEPTIEELLALARTLDVALDSLIVGTFARPATGYEPPAPEPGPALHEPPNGFEGNST